MDDEQGPWWTRPPEQAPPVQRRRLTGPQGVEVEEPPTGSAFAETTVIYPPTGPAPDEYPRPRLVEPAPEPEPEPPAPPPKPVVRRVAVVPPTPPPVRTVGRDPRDARTESMPPVRDGIFATFGGPGSPGQGGAAAPPRAVTNQPPAPDRRADDPVEGPPPEGPLAFLTQVNLPEPRVLLLGAAGALVVLLIVVVALVSGRGPDADPVASSPKPGSSPAAAEIVIQGQAPSGLKQVTPVDATAQLSKLGQGPGGSIVEAWGWTDKNGRNLVVTSIAPAGSNKRTLRVIHVAGLEGDKPRTLRVMRDPNLPANCRSAGQAGFTPKSLIVRDLDGNNVAEVISGWSSRCGGKAAESQIRLALITDGDKYILRGQGVIGEPGAFTPSPRAAQWPDGYLTQVTAQYRKLYG